MYIFINNRQLHHPPYATPPPATEPPPDEERKKVIKASQDYDQATQDIWTTQYKDRFAQIVQEYKSKGIGVGYLDKTAEYARVPSIHPMANEVQQFKDLAFRVDINGNAIVLPKD
jgi:hypothetical protein